VAERSRDRLAAAGVDLRFESALVRDLHKPRFGPPMRLTRDAASVMADVDVVVEVLGGVEPAWTLVQSALRSRIPVVSANKTLVARYGQELARTAARHGTTLVFDAAVLAGVPFLGSLARRPLVSHARYLAGIVNGTSQFIVSALGRGASFDDALAEAVSRGYAEPDSEADTGGRDAAEKLTILLHLAGCLGVSVSDLPCTRLGVLEPEHLAAARRLGGAIKPVALAALDPVAPGAWVGPAFVEEGHLFASLGGVTNALQIAIADEHAVTFAGPGAGPEVTAVTIVDDLVEAVTGARPDEARGLGAGAVDERRSLAASAFHQPPPGAWFVAVRGAGAPDGAWLDVPVVRTTRSSEVFAAITAPMSWRAVRAALGPTERRDGEVLVLPVVGEPNAHRTSAAKPETVCSGVK
jgi:homoserine dehydrogenase